MTVFVPGSEKMLDALPTICALHEGKSITALSVLSAFENPPFDTVKMTRNVINILNDARPEEKIAAHGIRTGWSRKDGPFKIYVQENESLTSQSGISLMITPGCPEDLQAEIKSKLTKPENIKALCDHIIPAARQSRDRGIKPTAPCP